MKCINRKIRINQNDYIQKRKIANCICKRKKKEWLNDKIKQIEKANRKNETRKFYKDSTFSNKKQTQIIPLRKDNNGAIISERISVLENWKQYFNKILNFETQQAKSNTEVSLQDNNEEEIEIPTYIEINNVLSKLKGNKAPGPDCIISELIKSGGYILRLRICNMILKIWNNEQIPEEWTEGIVSAIYKKGDQRLCNNYRPITLLNVVYKIFVILLHNRVCTMVEHKIGEYQTCFRLNRSTIDNIFMIRQIYEKCHEYNIELHVFVHFMQAFDPVNRSMIPGCLKQHKVPRKLINLVEVTLQQTKVKVKVNNMTEQFEITSGVKQGDPLSALLFSIVRNVILSKLEARGNISTRLKQISVYADDIIIIGRTKQVMIDMFTKLKNEASKSGLLINENKMKYMICIREQLRGNKLEIDTMRFESVQSFKYLRLVVNQNNTIEE